MLKGHEFKTKLNSTKIPRQIGGYKNPALRMVNKEITFRLRDK